ncbi:sulfotransferase 2A1-like isoform X2 [Peromyscus maniculatus bairdii]|uniref:sulfotransferase 2A1-like isoform X2 n=1 Tax=Peromyscus maniculatus bairdii TaxID=230844 RepID=UPI001C2E39DD|nr:sulfotransferase 2A1-like isoform X2 [Peromyscus maniculatus bairdii]
MSAYFWFEGIPFPAMLYKREIIKESRDKFVIRDEDTVIVTYPKSGTNWLIEIVCLIQTKGNPKWIQSVPTWERSPWIETKKELSMLINMEGPRLMSSHLPFHLFPKSFFRSKAKVIYVIRNPRDVLVSGYFFGRNTNLIDNPESLGTYIERFLKGNGNVITHLCCMLIHFPMSLLCNHSMHYFQNTRGTIRKICDFLGKKLEPDELDLVLKYSSFQAMKENKMYNFSIIRKDVNINGLVLMRKGVPGDWKNHFTVAQAENFDKVFQEKMAGFSPGLFPWK